MFEGFRQDMTVERVKEVPPELIAQLSNTGKFDYRRWYQVLPTVVGFSKEVWYVKYKSQPLLLIGALQLSLLDPSREVFMYGSKHIRWEMLPTLRSMFQEWLAMETEPLYARADDKLRSDFLKFFGFQFSHKAEDGTEVYRVL